MNIHDPKLLKKNPNVDQKVVSAIDTLQKQIPEAERQKKGSDYKLSPPFGGRSLTIVRREKGI